jgi:hypothetical protein
VKKITILLEIISVAGALASILWLFLDPGPEPFAASLVTLGVILGIAVQAQIKLSKAIDESLEYRLNALREIISIVDNIPKVSIYDLSAKLYTDAEYCKQLASRLVRLFGLRRELIPYLEPEFINLIDNELAQLYVIELGTYTFKNDMVHKLIDFCEKVTKFVQTTEMKLTKEYRSRF